MSKRLASFFAAHSGSSKRVKPRNPVEPPSHAPSPGWNVVLEGEFTLHERTKLRSTLQERGITVSSHISDDITHLILGTVSGEDDNGEPTGKGSRVHWAALDKPSIQIVKEEDIWVLLNEEEAVIPVPRPIVHGKPSIPAPLAIEENEANEEYEANEANFNPIPTLPDRPPFNYRAVKILPPKTLGKKKTTADAAPRGCVIPAAPTIPKVIGNSLAFDNRPSPASQGLNGNGESTAAIVRAPGTRPIPAPHGANAHGAATRAITRAPIIPVGPIVPEVIRPPYGFGTRPIPTPEVGLWRGLEETNRKYSTGRAKCGGCGNRISSGVMMVYMSEESLFRQLMGHLGSGGPKGARRGYIEVSIPPLGVNSIGKRRFWIHEGCEQKAIDKFKKRFENEWAVIREMLLAKTLIIMY